MLSVFQRDKSVLRNCDLVDQTALFLGLLLIWEETDGTVQNINIKSEHEVLYPYIPVLVVMMHMLVASCIVQR